MKLVKSGFLIILLAFILVGCESGTNVDTQKNEIPAGNLTEKVANFTEITSYTGDTDGDGADETVVLATSAERNSKGEFLWNDGQDWTLYVKDSSDGIYTLFNGFVQAGSVYFEVSDYYLKDGASPKISVIVSTGAGFSVKNYTFDKNQKVYKEDIIFDTKDVTDGGINRRFSSFPEINE